MFAPPPPQDQRLCHDFKDGNSSTSDFISSKYFYRMCQDCPCANYHNWWICNVDSLYFIFISLYDIMLIIQRSFI